MNNKTEAEYRSLAAHFYATRLAGQTPTPKKLCAALRQAANDYRPAYWRRLRKALEVDQQDKGFTIAAEAIAATKNPITSDPSRKGAIKPKQRRAKRISEEDENKLVAYLLAHKEREVYAAYALVRYLGCRPAEMASLRFEDGGKVYITGAKKRKDRGLDRCVIISDPGIYDHLVGVHPLLMQSGRKGPVRYAQKRLAVIAQVLWPQRKARPSLYSFRHQMGADLKASGKSAREVAALMGHRSTESVSAYGNRALSRDGREYIAAAPSTLAQVKVKPASTPPSIPQGHDRKDEARMTPRQNE